MIVNDSKLLLHLTLTVAKIGLLTSEGKRHNFQVKKVINSAITTNTDERIIIIYIYFVSLVKFCEEVAE